MRNSRPSSTAASLAFLALLFACCGFRAGDTLIGTFEALDAAGYPVIPATARAYWYASTVATPTVPAVIDSSDVLGSGIAALPRAASGNAGTYYFSYLLPSTGSNSVAGRYPQIFAKVRYTTSGGAISWTTANLGSPLNAGPDTMLATAVTDFYTQVATLTSAVVTPGVYGATTIQRNGVNTSGATVFLCRDSNGGRRIAQTQSTSGGQFSLVVGDLSPTAADTLYLWAWYAGAWIETGETIVIP